MVNKLIKEEYLYSYVDELIKGNKQKCLETVQSMVNSNMSIKDIYQHLFTESLHIIGKKWENNEISVAQEHIATYTTESLLASLDNLLQPQHTSKRGITAIVCCATNEHHYVGARMVSNLLETCGIETTFVGANTPTNDLIALIENLKPSIVAFSVSLYFNIPNFHKNAILIRNNFQYINIIAGGQGFNNTNKEEYMQENITLLKDFDELDDYIASNY